MGLTPLHLAALKDSKEIVRLLVQKFRMNPDTADFVSNNRHQAQCDGTVDCSVTLCGRAVDYTYVA